MDVGDFAREYSDFYFRVALMNHARGRTDSGDSARFCEACGGKIPKGRRIAMAGCRLCVACKANMENVERC